MVTLIKLTSWISQTGLFNDYEMRITNQEQAAYDRLSPPVGLPKQTEQRRHL